MKLKGDIIFGILMLVTITMFVSYSLGYSPSTRLVPLIIAVPGLVFMILQLIIDSLPGVSRRLGRLGMNKDLFGAEEIRVREKGAAEAAGIKKALAPARTRIPEAIMFVWIVWFVALIYLFGYLVAVPVFVFSFLKFRAGASWVFSILGAVLMEVVVYAGFVILLNVFLYKGLLFTLVSGRP